jgi:hypothetical protein
MADINKKNLIDNILDARGVYVVRLPVQQYIASPLLTLFGSVFSLPLLYSLFDFRDYPSLSVFDELKTHSSMWLF